MNLKNEINRNLGLSEDEIRILEEHSRQIRLKMFDLARQNGGYHYGGSLSCVDILVSLYEKVMGSEDRFILSKGHAAFTLYAILKQRGYNPKLSGHPDIDLKNGIYCTTGSLGMGFPTGLGMAFARKLQNRSGRIYVVLGEAECQEGTTWESLLLAAQHKLDNLTGIIDNNGYQGSGRVEDIVSLGHLEEKFKAFDAQVYHIDGHDHGELAKILGRYVPGKCTMIIAHTKKGKGAKIIEQDPAVWHGKFPSQEQFEQIYKDLGGRLT